MFSFLKLHVARNHCIVYKKGPLLNKYVGWFGDSSSALFCKERVSCSVGYFFEDKGRSFSFGSRVILKYFESYNCQTQSNIGILSSQSVKAHTHWTDLDWIGVDRCIKHV